ncbi:MAG: response regulator transcription factor [Anaerolineae bacterium]|jgi:DNA-binding NarL/FixJ family response regulator
MRVMLADSHTRIRWALRTVIEEEPGLNLVGEVSEARELLLQAQSLQPDLILLEWELPGRANGFFTELRALDPAPFVIVLSSQPELREAVLASGAEAFVSKADAPEQLLATLRSLVRQ